MLPSPEKPLYWLGLSVANNVFKQKRRLFKVLGNPRVSAGLGSGSGARQPGTVPCGLPGVAPPRHHLHCFPDDLHNWVPEPPHCHLPKEQMPLPARGALPHLGCLSVRAVIQNTNSDQGLININVFLAVLRLGI